MRQAITSAETSLNQIPALYKTIPKLLLEPGYWGSVSELLDFGGGAYDVFVDELARLGTRSLVYDPFNRSDEHNTLVVRLLVLRPAATAVCANVLNVIREPGVRAQALELMRRLTAPSGDVFISTHAGTGTSRGTRTSRGWQSNRPTRSYLREVRRVFPRAFYSGGLIISGPDLEWVHR